MNTIQTLLARIANSTLFNPLGVQDLSATMETPREAAKQAILDSNAPAQQKAQLDALNAKIAAGGTEGKDAARIKRVQEENQKQVASDMTTGWWKNLAKMVATDLGEIAVAGAVGASEARFS